MQATGRIAVPSGYLLKDVTPTQAELAHGLGRISLRGTPHCSLSGHPLPLLSPLLPLHAACALPTRRWMATLKSGEDQEEELAPRCAKRKQRDPFLDRWDAIGQTTLKGLCRDLRRNNKVLALTTSPPPVRVGAMREYLRMYY